MPHCNKQMISFFLTTKCNLNCRYCYNIDERKKMDEKTLSLEIAQAGIDFFFEHYNSRHIRFYGPGEPTQEFQLMKQITEYAKCKDDKTTVEIQTNGVFGKEVREWILENMNIVWISFDGPPDIQNYNRPIGGKYPSAPIIEENVRWLNENDSDKKIMVGARVTITSINIERQKEMVDYFANLGIRHIWTDPMFPSVGEIPVCNDDKKMKSYKFDMDSYLKNYVEAFYYAKKKDVFYGSFLACNFDGLTKYHCRACTPVPHLTPDGYISACDMVVLGENAHHMDCFIYGRWDFEDKKFIFYEDKIAELRSRSVENMEHCHNCEAKLYCGGYCLGEIVNETGNLRGEKTVVCDAIRRLLKTIGPNQIYEFLHP